MNGEKERQEPNFDEMFPFKTYDEIQAEKNRKNRFRQAMVVVTGIFLMFCAIIIGISMIWNNTTNLFHVVASPAKSKLGTDEKNIIKELNDKGFTLSESPVPKAEKRVMRSEGGIIVTDVSEAVAKAKQSVVGIEAENYDGIAEAKTGSGIVLSENGYIMTSSHVIADCDSITVILNDGECYSAFVIGDDSYSDIAVIKIDAGGLKTAVLGTSDDIKVGQAAIAVGNPAGQSHGTASTGIISGVEHNVMIDNSMITLIQTDAAINATNAGGPLLNQYGQVIGINYDKATVDGCGGLGFAVPINTAKKIAEELVRNGVVSGRPMLGIYGSGLSLTASHYFGLPQGIYVSDVAEGSPADDAGIQVGDVILKINGKDVHTMASAYMTRDLYRAGDELEITFYRNGANETTDIQLMDQNDGSENSNF